MATAVIGSMAPMMAVGVEPMLCTATTISISDSTVGITANWTAYAHCLMVVSICVLSFIAAFMHNMVMTPKSST